MIWLNKLYFIIIIQVDLCTSDEEEEECDQDMNVQEEEFVCHVIVPNNFKSLV